MLTLCTAVSLELSLYIKKKRLLNIKVYIVSCELFYEGISEMHLQVCQSKIAEFSNFFIA